MPEKQFVLPRMTPIANATRNIHVTGLPRFQIPPAWRTWLFDTGSLTARLMQLPDPFRVDLLRQRHAPATALEQRLLHLPQRALPLVREVTLYSGELPLVRARSVIPRPTENGVGRPLTRLGTRPLGAALFSDPRVRRGDIRMGYTRFPGEAESAVLWVRHCQFLIAGEAILVSEYFLPACLNLWAPPNPHPPIAGGRFERARH